MQSFLENFYYGDEVKFYGPSNHAEFANVKERVLEKLNESLDGREKDLFEKYCAAQADLDDIARYEKFAYGFRLGARMMLDAFSDGQGRPCPPSFL